MKFSAKACCALAFCFFATASTSASSYELIPSWKRIDKTTEGLRYIYTVFYVNTLDQRISFCAATFEESNKLLTLECRDVVNLNWKLPKSTNIRSALVGQFSNMSVEDNNTISFGLWQIDEITGDWQFCMDASVAGKVNCVLSGKQ